MRKSTFLLGLLLVWTACDDRSYPPINEEVAHLFQDDLFPFYHGVASGDPLPDGIVIWTRVSPRRAQPQVMVEWEVALDNSFQTIVQSGQFVTDSGRDYTVKIDVTGLAQGTKYFYRFRALNRYSAVGRTKTAAQDASELNFAVVSCSNYEWGYFNAYGNLAEQDNLDAIIHLGDYIYEYGPGYYGDTTIGRFNLPAREIISLQDYRTRYSLYRLDPDLREAHGAHPFINIWDDHEIANNSYTTGAENHQDNEGSYQSRKEAAVKAYYEWLPIREGGEHYRKFEFGDLAELIMLDERLEGRTRPLDSLSDPTLLDESRSMLGEKQLSWFMERLKSSNSRWKVIGNQVIFSYLNWGYEPSFTINLDSWDGYPVEQRKIADFIAKEVEDVIFITGDTHSSWAFEVTIDPQEAYRANADKGGIAVEFGTTSINSANADERSHPDSVRAHEQFIQQASMNPHLKYANLRDHGYLLLSLSEEEALASWYFVTTLREKNRETTLGKQLKVPAGLAKLSQ